MGHAYPTHVSTRETIAWYASESGAWDFRAGGERDATEDRLGPEERAATLSAASALGMVKSAAPRRAAYDHMVVLGGLARGCFTRTRYAGELVRRGIETRSVTALGAFRLLGPQEIALMERLEMHTRYEVTSLLASMRHVFDAHTVARVVTGHGVSVQQASLGPPVHDVAATLHRLDNLQMTFDRWLDMTITSIDSTVSQKPAASPTQSDTEPRWKNPGRGTQLRVCAAPSSAPEIRRANTADTLSWWATKTGLPEGSQILLITSEIYVPYQTIIALRHLSMAHNVNVEVVGVSKSAGQVNGQPLRFTAADYLQELRSIILALQSLDDLLGPHSA